MATAEFAAGYYTRASKRPVGHAVEVMRRPHYAVTITRGEETEPQIVRPLRGCAGLAAMLAQPIGNAIPPAS
jgi:hypothetical protein